MLQLHTDKDKPTHTTTDHVGFTKISSAVLLFVCHQFEAQTHDVLSAAANGGT
jgi:hypothetical protein